MLTKQKKGNVAIYSSPLALPELPKKVEYVDVKLTGEADNVGA